MIKIEIKIVILEKLKKKYINEILVQYIESLKELKKKLKILIEYTQNLN